MKREPVFVQPSRNAMFDRAWKDFKKESRADKKAKVEAPEPAQKINNAKPPRAKGGKTSRR